jgi:subtilisin family serine protease
VVSERVYSPASTTPTFIVGNIKKSFTKHNVVPVEKAINATPDTNVFISEIEFLNLVDQAEYFTIIHDLQETTEIVKASPAYTISGKKLGLSNNFYVKLASGNDVDTLYALASEFAIQVLGYNEYMPLWYSLSCTKETPFNALVAANLFYETQLFENAEPEFLYHDLLASNDTYFSSQWGLQNTGQYGGMSNIDINVEDAWSITTGSPNIRVAVFDEGIEMNHPDLMNNIYGIGYDVTTGTTPSTVWGRHGTTCAGIIGAQQNNSIGISGVAPISKLISLSVSFNSVTPQQLANGFNWARQNGADVISNSWGGGAPSDIIEDAITAALTQGRNGKGMVVVFAAGNENNTSVRYPGNSNPLILVVGAISPCGERKSYTSCDGELWGSCYGTTLDVVAPGVLIPTTDRQANEGYNPNVPLHLQNGGNKINNDYSNKDYSVWFNGTSAACPHVAGVAALILSANPDLTAQQVTNIIESTAQKVGTYTYQPTSGRPNGTWNEEMGYGLIDASAAVMAALTVNGADTMCSADIYTLSSGTASSWSVTPTSAFSLTSTYTASAVVKPLHLSGQAGTLTATVHS